MRRLALLGILGLLGGPGLAGCTPQAADWVAVASRDTATALHRHRVRQDLRAIRAAQERPRVVIVRREPHGTGRRLGITLAAKVEGGLDTSAERARFAKLDPGEQDACVASYSRHAPRSEAGRAVLEGLWDARD